MNNLNDIAEVWLAWPITTGQTWPLICFSPLDPSHFPICPFPQRLPFLISHFSDSPISHLAIFPLIHFPFLQRLPSAYSLSASLSVYACPSFPFPWNLLLALCPANSCPHHMLTIVTGNLDFLPKLCLVTGTHKILTCAPSPYPFLFKDWTRVHHVPEVSPVSNLLK